MRPPPKHILCVDDDADTCAVMAALLNLSGYEVRFALTAAAGLQLARDEQFDLYLIDNYLPGESGLELCAQLCRLDPGTPVVFLSAAAFEKDRLEGIKAGALSYLTKPFAWGVLEETLVRLVDEGRENRRAEVAEQVGTIALPADRRAEEAEAGEP